MSQDIFQNFDSMFSMFWVFFSIVFALGIGFTILFDQMASGAQSVQPVAREKEIIREVIKIRCPYCGNLYDENQTKCPNCGANR
jgi:DNA-directed RNA polymerase subunit RPC12/RpoP